MPMDQINEGRESLYTRIDQPKYQQEPPESVVRDSMARPFPAQLSHPLQTDLRSYADRGSLTQISNAGAGVRQRPRSTADCMLWVGNVHLDITRAQLHELFQNHTGFLSVSEIRNKPGSHHRNGYGNRGWALIQSVLLPRMVAHWLTCLFLGSFETSGHVAEAVKTLPESEILKGQGLVANPYQRKPLPHHSHDRHSTESNARRWPSHGRAVWSETPKCTSKNSHQNPQQRQEQNNRFRPRSAGPNPPPGIEHNDDCLDVARDDIRNEVNDTRESGCRESLTAGMAFKHSARSDREHEEVIGNANRDVLRVIEEGASSEQKSKRKMKKARDRDKKPPADAVVGESSTGPLKLAKDLSRDFPPLLGPAGKVLVDGSCAAAVKSDIGGKSFARVLASQSTPNIQATASNDESLLISQKTSRWANPQLDGPQEFIVANEHASRPTENIPEKSTNVPNSQKLSARCRSEPEIESQSLRTESAKSDSNCSMHNDSGSKPLPRTARRQSATASQPMTRNSSSSMDYAFSFMTAGVDSTGASSYQQASRRDSKALYESLTSDCLHGNQPSTGIDPEHLRDRLQVDSLGAKYDLTDTFEEAESKSDSSVEQKGAITDTDRASVIPMLTACSHETPRVGPEQPKKLYGESSASQPSTPGPITTHKKSVRSKVTTPTKQSSTKLGKSGSGGGSTISQYRYSSLSPSSATLTGMNVDLSAVVREVLH